MVLSGSGFFNSECFTTPVFETQNHAGYDTRRKKSDKLLKMAVLVFAWTLHFSDWIRRTPMKMEWFELASRSVVVLDQVNSFREESALQWGPVVGTTLRVVSSEAIASLEQHTPNTEEQSAVLPEEDRDPVYEEVYDLEKVFGFFLEYCKDRKNYRL